MSDDSDMSQFDIQPGNEPMPDQTDEVDAAMAEARARLAGVPAEVVIVNHVMGMYELAAIHLSADTADLVSASLAIDAMSMLVEGLGDRLGSEAATMGDALANIRMAFVAMSNQAGTPAE